MQRHLSLRFEATWPSAFLLPHIFCMRVMRAWPRSLACGRTVNFEGAYLFDFKVSAKTKHSSLVFEITSFHGESRARANRFRLQSINELETRLFLSTRYSGKISKQAFRNEEHYLEREPLTPISGLHSWIMKQQHWTIIDSVTTLLLKRLGSQLGVVGQVPSRTGRKGVSVAIHMEWLRKRNGTGRFTL